MGFDRSQPFTIETSPEFLETFKKWLAEQGKPKSNPTFHEFQYLVVLRSAEYRVTPLILFETQTKSNKCHEAEDNHVRPLVCWLTMNRDATDPSKKPYLREQRSFHQWISFFCIVVIMLAYASIGMICFLTVAAGSRSGGGSIILGGCGLVFCGISAVVASSAWLSWKGIRRISCESPY